MKKLSNNKKGFTLIELLAVIVILAVIILIATPAVTNYLDSARKGAFVLNAKESIYAVRNDVVVKGYSNKTYSLAEINALLDKKLTTSPYGLEYTDGSYIRVEKDTSGNYTYYMCLSDGTHGFTETKEADLNDDAVKEDQTITCTVPQQN